MSSFNILDIIFFTLTFFIVLVACYRGAVKEVFSLLNWIIAFALSYLISPYLADLLSPYFDSRLVLDVSVRIATFILSFIAFFFLTGNFTQDLSESINIYINRLLGLFFGVIKSLLIFGLVFSLYNCFFDYALGKKFVRKDSVKMPKWFNDSYSAPIITFSGEIIDPAVRGFIGILKINFSEVLKTPEIIKNGGLDNEYTKELLKEKAIENQNNSNIETPKQEVKKNSFTQQKNDLGYDKKDIEKMQRLIEIINQ
jgi:membrane protein required for colicin V production